MDISAHVVIGYGDPADEPEEEEESEEEPESEEPAETKIETKMTYNHTKPGEYSEVYLTVTTSPGVTIDVTLKGPGVDGEPSQSQNADGDGVAKFTWRIVAFGTYSVNGVAGGAQFISAVTVQ